MFKLVYMIVVCVLFHLTASAQTPLKLSDMSWLAGCWESRNDAKRSFTSEQWMIPAGGIMLGISRTLDSGKAVDFESMRIEQSGAGLIFYARPRANREETAFNLVRKGAAEVVFENKKHDFPQRVIYRRDGDRLMARIEGEKDGQLIGVDYRMTRASCTADLRAGTAAAAETAAPGTCPGTNGLLAAEISDILSAHNAVRRENNLAPLTWDCTLADTAQEWATRGIFEHRVPHKYGESLYVSSASTVKAVTAVQQWMLEKTSWDDKQSACAAGKVCTHYTQIVWKKTDRLGCGINRNAPGKWKVLLVCNYEPAGNTGGSPF